MNNTKSKITFSRSEKTVLIDSINWFIDESQDSLFIEELTDTQKNTLEKINSDLTESNSCEVDSEISSFIIDTIIPNFGQELKEQIGLPEVENKQSTGEFYRTQFESITDKLNSIKKEQNPFF